MRKLAMVAVGLALALGGCANGVNQGLTHYNAGQYDQAAARWNTLAQQGDPAAQNNVGLLLKDGLGSTPKDLNQAAYWFLQSARQGLPIAMVNLAKVQLESNQPDPALSWLNMAARWNDAEAIGILRSMSAPVPAPDLYQAQQQQLAVQQQRAAENQAQLGFALGCIIGGGCPQQTALSQPGGAPYGYKTYRLRQSWWNAGKRMCQYADGSVLNVGSGTCPSEVSASR